jgi:hypothetical protein
MTKKRWKILVAIFAVSTIGCDPVPASSAVGAVGADDIVGTFTEVTDGEWQGVVAVMLDDDPWPCTGTLIDPEVVLTAAHCVVDYSSFAIRNGVDMETLLADVTTATPCPNYDGTFCDVALLKLDHAVTEIPFFGIKKDSLPSVGTSGKLLGYGVTSTWGEDYGVLRIGNSDVLDYQSEYDDAIVEIGGESGHCYGDSGGPYFVDEGGAWVVDAVTSFGGSEDCTYVDQSYSTNTVKYAQWIEDTVNELTGHGLLDPGGVDGGTDTDADSDTDTDTDADSDTDSDSDSDSDAGTEDDDSSNEDSCGCAFAGAPTNGERPWRLLEILF